MKYSFSVLNVELCKLTGMTHYHSGGKIFKVIKNFLLTCLNYNFFKCVSVCVCVCVVIVKHSLPGVAGTIFSSLNFTQKHPT